MPRIRKRTSNRQNTRDRAKIKKKVKESNRKSRKESKRDVTWKSNKRRDLGVPNSFPFKDQVLAEQAEEKRAADEAKLAARRKPVEEEEDAPGIASVNTAVMSGTISLPGATASEEEEAEDEDIPDLIDTQLATLQDVLDRSDLVLQVVDARDIAGGRSKFVESMVKDAGGQFGLIINKIDLVPRETLSSWFPHLPENTFLFKSHLNTTNIPSSSKTPLPHQPEQTLGKAELISALTQLATASKKSADEPFVVGLFGLPNVGKTSILNSLLGQTKGKYPTAPVVPLAASAKALGTTTKVPVEVALVSAEERSVHVIDTPGWEPVEDEENEEEEEEDEEDELDEEKMAKLDQLQDRIAGDMLRRNIGRVDKVKDVFPLAEYIITRSNPQDLMLAYNVPYFTPGDVQGFLTGLARVTARMKKHGDADLDSAARHLLRDWSHNAFPFYSIPPKSNLTSATAPAAEPHAHATAVLEKVRSRKEMRTSGKGLVRFKSGDVDEREVILDDDYTTLVMSSDDEDEDDDEDDDEEEEEEDDEEEEEEEDDEEEVPILIGSDEGEELELEDDPEPESSSDVSDDEEEEEEEEEAPVSSKLKRKLAASPEGKLSKKARRGTLNGSANGDGIGNGSIAVPEAKAKRVSFGRDVVLGPRGGKKDEGFKGLGKRRR